MTAAWAHPDDGNLSRQPDLPGPDRARHTDDLLGRLVTRRLRDDPRTRHEPITVTVQNRVVILNGYVGSAKARRVAGAHAWDIPITFDVCNALRLPDRHGPY